MDKTQELQDAYGAWAEDTFGTSNDSFSTLWNLIGEIKDLIEEVEKVEMLTKIGKVDKETINDFHNEWANVWLLVLDAARRDGLTIDDLNRFGFRKLRINKKEDK